MSPARPTGTRATDAPAWGSAWWRLTAGSLGFDDLQVARGRGLSSRGGVVEFSVEPASASGAVGGRTAVERRVRLGFRRFTPAQWDAVAGELRSSTRFVAALLDGLLPTSLHDRLVGIGCSLVPSAADMSVDCTCGGHSPCGHAAAVCSRLAEAIDADPLLLITLRGGDRGELLADLVPSAARTARPAGTAAPSRRASIIPGRPADPGMSAAAAWRRRLDPVPLVDLRRGAPGKPRIGSVPPSADLGFDQAGLDRLVRDAAVRARALLAGESADLALALDNTTDAVRRVAVGTLGPAVDLPFTSELTGVLADAWRRCGAAGVEVVVRPARLSPADLAAVESACDAPVKGRSTGAVLPDARQVRRAADGTWVLLHSDPDHGWVVVEAGADLEELLG